MRRKVLFGSAIVVLGFLGFVATRSDHFHYEKSGNLQAPAARVFPYLEDLHKGQQWVPYMEKDPNMKITFSGPASGVGSRMEFAGNSEVGAGTLEIVKVVPNEAVDIKLTMTSPMHGENLVYYRLAPENGSTRFTWGMEGRSGFLGKLVGVFIDCEKMIGDDFAKGIAKLKSIVEAEGSNG